MFLNFIVVFKCIRKTIRTIKISDMDQVLCTVGLSTHLRPFLQDLSELFRCQKNLFSWNKEQRLIATNAKKKVCNSSHQTAA